MNIAIIIQARVDSKRFPEKVLKIISGKPMLWHVIERCKKVGIPIIVSTSKRSIDNPVVEIAKKSEVFYFRGSTKNVLERFYQTSKKFNLDYIIRVTADNPLVDPKLGKKIKVILQKNNFDYVGIDKNFPIGIGLEGISFKALKITMKKSTSYFEQGHVTPFIKNPKNKFNIKIIKCKQKLDHFNFSVDTPNDLKFIKSVYSNLYTKKFISIEDAITLIKKSKIT